MESIGVVIRRWVWLKCIGVVSGWCCKEVYYRFPHITYCYSTCISSFVQQHPYLSFFVHLKNVFSFFIIYTASKVALQCFRLFVLLMIGSI